MSFKQAVTLFQQNRVKRPGKAAHSYRQHAGTLVVLMWVASSCSMEISGVKKLKCN